METPSPDPSPTEPQARRCMNCDAELQGTYCHHCGQEDEPSVLALGTLLKDLWETFMAVDAKLLRTLGLLVAKPGMLTCEYLAGRRARYISPFKLYFWTTALFVLFAFRAFYIEDETLRMGDNNAIQIRNEIESDDMPKAPPGAPKTPRVQPVADKGKSPPPPKPALGKEDAKEPSFLATFDERPLTLFGVRIDPKLLPETVTEYQNAQNALAASRRDNAFVHLLKVKIIRLRNNRYDFARNLIYGALPNILLFAVPLWALMMLVFFRRPRRLYIEHLVFALHGHTVAVLLAMLAMALIKSADMAPGTMLQRGSRAVLDSMPMWASAYLLGYLFLAARRVYRQHPIPLLLKGGCLTAGYGCIFLFAVALGAVVTLLSLLMDL